MKKIMKFWNDHEIWFIIGVIFLLSLISTFCYFYSDIALNFKKDNPNGEFFKVILSVLGGIGLFYGLWINSQRIKAQNKQNKLVEDRNQDQKSYDADKRFGEAIGYLGSDKTSIILGGIYALYQLAKEDKRYISIVAGLLTSYLRDNSHKLLIQSNPNFSIEEDEFIEYSYKAPIIVNSIIDLLFNNDKDLFKQELLDLSGVFLVSINFKYNVTKCVFDHSKLYCCFFNSSIEECSFEYSELKYCYFGKEDSTIENCSFFKSGLSGVNFIASELNNLDFTLAGLGSTIDTKKMIDCNLQSSTYINLEIIGVQDFNKTIFNKSYKDKIEFVNCVDVQEDKYI